MLRSAHADDIGCRRDEPVASAIAYCAGDGKGHPASPAPPTTLESAGPAELLVPVAALEATRRIKLCKVAEDPDPKVPVEVKQYCGQAKSGLTAIATTLVVEIGTYGKGIAEQQVLDYVFEKFLTQTCDFSFGPKAAADAKSGAKVPPSLHVSVKELLPETCALKRDASDLTLQSLGATLRRDIHKLPDTLAGKARNVFTDLLKNE